MSVAPNSRASFCRVYKWELDKGDESLTIAVNGSLLLDDVDLVIQALLVLPDSEATPRRPDGCHYDIPACRMTSGGSNRAVRNLSTPSQLSRNSNALYSNTSSPRSSSNPEQS
jgi:hypothetical protein